LFSVSTKTEIKLRPQDLHELFKKKFKRSVTGDDEDDDDDGDKKD